MLIYMFMPTYFFKQFNDMMFLTCALKTMFAFQSISCLDMPIKMFMLIWFTFYHLG